ncbi:MAG: adenosylcobinamide-phosphate synthase CbiB [Polaromonas sp.]|uniref:adenosylcobinamide-phosphate synthase CbiB n=1 Tax=Polaromonas sp. TaxID=1869339 RepID=UPI0027330516|nr:adenosylcobinamide-phosphate synthase CbiB [Polaromonas sp.]MDP2818041.1 adenosylcobinamide-phosphate synthase CbiB [Polaromonas sp.]
MTLDFDAVACALALLVALAIDCVFGEPAARWHPVVWMGSFLKRMEPLLLRQPPWPPQTRDLKAFGLAALVWIAGAAIVFIAAMALQWAIFQLHGWLAALLLGVALKPMFAWRMLRSEVQAVEDALQTSLTAGRDRLAMLVSRDTAHLSESEVRESAIESLAENLSDSVVAPIFWFVLFGLPGAAIYRFANTADAMWGYRGRWEWAGKWAARADDVLSWVPARLTAVLIWAVTRTFRLRTLRPEALRTPSPNSGWPMAAMALTLGVGLRKPGVYALNAAGRAPQALDTLLALDVASKVVVALAVLAPTAMLLIATGVAR